MAENPAEWSKATALVSDVLNHIRRQEIEDAANDVFRCGFTVPMQITVALSQAGYLTEEALTRRMP